METDLISRLISGDDTSFKEIYELYHFKVLTFVKKYTSQPADAEDVTQNVFIHLWKYRTRLSIETGLDAVLFKSSKQEISKWYKKQNRIFTLDTKEAVAELDMPYDDEESTTKKLEQIAFLLEQIPERRRKIFTLHKFHDRSYNEIAQEMNMSPSAVANQISKTLQYLKKNSVSHCEFWWIAIVFFNT